VLLKEDALFSIPGATKRIVMTTDLDGDGLRDLVLSRGRRRHVPFKTQSRIEAVSSKSGESLRIYWSSDDLTDPVEGWDAGGDVDSDGCGDVLLGFPRATGMAGALCGRVEVRSGADGSVLHYFEGRASHDNLGYSVAFLGDIDRDGRAEMALGAPQMLRSWPGDAYETPDSIPAPETRVGYVVVRSGRDCTELYSVTGTQPGARLGSDVMPTGDADDDGLCDWIASCFDTAWISGKSGVVLTRVPRYSPWASIARGGDLDGDGYADLLIDQLVEKRRFANAVQVFSGRTRSMFWQARYPGPASEFPTAVALGDVDGDGHDDVGIGDGDFRICGDPRFHHWSASKSALRPVPDLRSMTVEDALRIESEPHFAGFSESGCALIYSGRTREVIFGVFGGVDSSDGIGLTMAPLPDVSGDGWPDIAIGGRNAIYVFAGPGLSASRVK
jgi:hypothetical protein